ERTTVASLLFIASWPLSWSAASRRELWPSSRLTVPVFRSNGRAANRAILELLSNRRLESGPASRRKPRQCYRQLADRLELPEQNLHRTQLRRRSVGISTHIGLNIRKALAHVWISHRDHHGLGRSCLQHVAQQLSGCLLLETHAVGELAIHHHLFCGGRDDVGSHHNLFRVLHRFQNLRSTT